MNGAAFEKENFKAQDKFEKEISGMIGKDREKAIRKITDYTSAKAIEVYEKADKLIKKLE